MRIRVLGLSALVACAMAATADAATLVNADGVLTFTAAPGSRDIVTLRGGDDGTVTLRAVSRKDVQPSGCTTLPTPAATEFDCAGVNSIVIDAGDGADDVSGGTAGAPMTVLRRSRRRHARRRARPATCSTADPETTASWCDRGDVARGGSGIDEAQPWFGWNVSVSLSLDGAGNDGSAGAAANVLPDVENVRHTSNGASTIDGDDAANELTGSDGDDAIFGGGGSDSLSGNGGADMLVARDDAQDRVDCGAGADTALVDQFDQVGDSCETCGAKSSPSRARIMLRRWPGPGRGARCSRPGRRRCVCARPTTAACARSRCFDDDRVVCTDSAAPFTCGYRRARPTSAATRCSPSRPTRAARPQAACARGHGPACRVGTRGARDAAPCSSTATER